MCSYWISVTDGTRFMRTVFAAPDAVFACMKATAFFEGTKWRVLSKV
jgi:hypothetical protein